LEGPPGFVSEFVQKHVRVCSSDSGVCVELWERPKAARVHLRAAERIGVVGRPRNPPRKPSRGCEPLKNCKWAE
jgi:hypothetical protein